MVTSGRIAAIARRYAAAAVVAAAVTGALVAPRPAHAIDTGAAVGIGLGSFALGSMLGAASNPYYGNPTGMGTRPRRRPMPIRQRRPTIRRRAAAGIRIIGATTRADRRKAAHRAGLRGDFEPRAVVSTLSHWWKIGGPEWPLRIW